MNSSLDHVEFLSHSESRVRVLNTIYEQPRTRNELKDLTDVSYTPLRGSPEYSW